MNILSRPILGTLAGIALAASLAACGSAAASSPASSSAPPSVGQSAPAPVATQPVTPANPVPILRQAGVPVPPGTVNGDHDVSGDRMATGQWPTGESVTVYTSADQTAFAAEQANVQPDDSTGVILIPGKYAVIVVNGSSGIVPGQSTPSSPWAGGETPAQVAARVHGQLVQP
jgi:hypothetical protein